MKNGKNLMDNTKTRLKGLDTIQQTQSDTKQKSPRDQEGTKGQHIPLACCGTMGLEAISNSVLNWMIVSVKNKKENTVLLPSFWVCFRKSVLSLSLCEEWMMRWWKAVKKPFSFEAEWCGDSRYNGRIFFQWFLTVGSFKIDLTAERGSGEL